MGILEDVPPELYTILVPALVGVGLIGLTVLVVFWIGLRRPKSFEEAKASASRRADLVLQEKANQNSPRARKTKKPFPTRKKKKTDQWEESQEELTAATNDSQTPKGILKPVTVTSRKEPTPERSPRNRVGFQIETAVKEEATPRVSPPTPHPAKTAPVFKQEMQRTAQPLFEEIEEEEEEEEENISLATAPPSSKPKAPETKKPSTVSSSSSSSPKPAAQKKKQKIKKESVEGAPDDGLPASKIVEIVGVSPLSDDDIQQLMSVLLEKINTNSEWEAANLRSESVKSLKKQNQDLQIRCGEAEKTVHSHNSKIKELRTEIQNERAKHQSADNVQQGKIAAQGNELTIVKTRLDGMEKENARLKSVNTQKVEDENAQLRGQLLQVTTTQQQHMSSQNKQLQDLTDENSALKTDLHRVKDALKSATTGQPRADRVAELESLLGNMEEEKQELQSNMQIMNDENARLKAEAASIQSALSGMDQLKAKTGNLEIANTSLAAEKSELHKEIEVLRNSSNSLQTAESGDALRAQLDKEMAREVETVRGELMAKHEVKVQELHQTISELEEQCGERKKEVAELTAQIDKCSSLQDQLRAIGEELTGEQTAKKQLEQELESIKTATPNGPSSDEPDTATNRATPPANEEEVTQLKEEKAELVQTVQDLEKKLDDLKVKNNSLRDTLWKAKDSAAADATNWESEVKKMNQRAEERCKDVRKKTLAEARTAHKEFLVQLFPVVSVTTCDFAGWLDEFEVKVRDILEEKDEEVSSLRSKVAELEDNEQKSIQEAEQFRQTLQETMGILGKLQAEVEGHNAEHQMLIEEKDEMIQRERTTNMRLQEELRTEKELTSSLKTDLEQATSEGADSEDEARVKELEERLKEAEHQLDNSKHESESLRHSLQNELELKEKAHEQLEEQQERQAEMEKRIAADEVDKVEKIKAMEAEMDQLKSQLKEADEKNLDKKQSDQDVAPPNPATETEI